MSSLDAEPSERVVTTLRAGDSFGELSLLYNMRREASISIEDFDIK